MTIMKKIFSPQKVLIFTISLIVAFVLFHLVFQYLFLQSDLSVFLSDVARRFNLDHEASIPTWYAQILLFILAQILFYFKNKIPPNTNRKNSPLFT